MRKLTLSGEYCFDNEEWINWWGDVELDDEQVNNLIEHEVNIPNEFPDLL